MFFEKMKKSFFKILKEKTDQTLGLQPKIQERLSDRNDIIC